MPTTSTTIAPTTAAPTTSTTTAAPTTSTTTTAAPTTTSTTLPPVTTTPEPDLSDPCVAWKNNIASQRGLTRLYEERKLFWQNNINKFNLYSEEEYKGKVWYDNFNNSIPPNKQKQNLLELQKSVIKLEEESYLASEEYKKSGDSKYNQIVEINEQKIQSLYEIIKAYNDPNSKDKTKFENLADNYWNGSTNENKESARSDIEFWLNSMNQAKEQLDTLSREENNLLIKCQESFTDTNDPSNRARKTAYADIVRNSFQTWKNV